MKKNTEIKELKATIGKGGKVLSGTVVSNKMQKTVVVSVDRYVKHPKYQKYFNISKKFKAHDEANVCKEGDKVEIKECRPLSKDKNFKVISINGNKVQ